MDAPAPRILVHRHGRVLSLVISNPAMRNALSPDLYPLAARIVRDVAGDADLGAVVLSGEGEHFCGGGNLKRLQAQRGLPPETQARHLDHMHDFIAAMHECPKPILAAVEGAAAGGGFSIVLACDLVVAAEDAKFVMSYAKVGLSPDGGGSEALARSLPAQAALEILLDAAPVGAARLHALGVVNRVVPHGQAFETALAWAQRLASGAGAAHARIKHLVRTARGRTLREQLDAERDAFVASLYGEEAGEGIGAFLDKRTPEFTKPPQATP